MHRYRYQSQELIRGGACNATVGWVESLLENDVTYGCGKSIHSNFHSPYKESKDSRYIRWLWLYEQVSSRHRASSKRNLLLQSLVVPGFKRGSPSFPPSQPSCTRCKEFVTIMHAAVSWRTFPSMQTTTT